MQLEHLKIIVYEFFLVGGGGGEKGRGKNALWATGNTNIYYCVFCYPKLRVGAVFTGMQERSRMTRIKLWCTVMVLSIHITSGVIFLGLFVFPKGCVQVGTVKVHMSCVRIQLHW